jgi:hypothetical protein
VSAVDAPPGVAFAGRAAGELVARPASLRLARWACLVVVATSALSLFLVIRGGYRAVPNGAEGRLVAPLVAIAIAMVCLAVRRARLRIDGAGVRWGWETLGFRVLKDRLSGATVYRDAVAFRRPGGAPWYLARYDFADFDRLPVLLRTAGLGFEVDPGRAPFRSRLQTYGVALDLLIVLDCIFAALTFLVVIGA